MRLILHFPCVHLFHNPSCNLIVQYSQSRYNPSDSDEIQYEVLYFVAVVLCTVQ